MSVDRITFEDKVSLITSPLPEINRITGGNVNEIKDVANNHADNIEEINTRLSSIVTSVSESVEITSNAGSPASGTVTLTKEGYYPIGIARITSNANKFFLQEYGFTNMESGTATVAFKYYNGDSSTWHTTVTITVIWIKE